MREKTVRYQKRDATRTPRARRDAINRKRERTFVRLQKGR